MVLERLLNHSPTRLAEQMFLKRKAVTPLHAIATIRGQGSLSDERCRAMLRDEAIRLCQQPNRSLLEVQSSSIDGAGRGVFASSNLKAGQVLGTYGGTYIPPIPICGSPEPILEPKLLLDIQGDYIFCCEGGGWLDGKDHGLPQTRGCHDFVHLVNHGTEPNAETVTIHGFPSGMGVKALPVGTPWYFSPEDDDMVPMPKSVILKTAILVSLRDIMEGEELFFDYDINPPSKRPEWFQAAPKSYLEEAMAAAVHRQ